LNEIALGRGSNGTVCLGMSRDLANKRGRAGSSDDGFERDPAEPAGVVDLLKAQSDLRHSLYTGQMQPNLFNYRPRIVCHGFKPRTEKRGQPYELPAFSHYTAKLLGSGISFPSR